MASHNKENAHPRRAPSKVDRNIESYLLNGDAKDLALIIKTAQASQAKTGDYICQRAIRATTPQKSTKNLRRCQIMLLCLDSKHGLFENQKERSDCIKQIKKLLPEIAQEDLDIDEYDADNKVWIIGDIRSKLTSIQEKEGKSTPLKDRGNRM